MVETFELPTTDERTGMSTRAYFRHQLDEQLLPHADAEGEPLSVFFLDVDNFTDINTDHGRDVGDRVIADVAAVLADLLPAESMLCHYSSGDEFAGALPGVALDVAFTHMEDVRRAVRDHRVAGARGLELSCSIGLAMFPRDGRGSDELLREADQALYAAKLTGRNRVALPVADSRMVTKTSHYTPTQLERLARLAEHLDRKEAAILREALDDVLRKYRTPTG